MVAECIKLLSEGLGGEFLSARKLSLVCKAEHDALSVLCRERDILLEYIHKRKLIMATEMIEKTALSYAEISRRLGFGGAQYFGKFILKYTGKTPGEYRLSARGDSEGDI